MTVTLLHDTFTHERTYDASVSEVWHAWNDPELRPKWFRGPTDYVVLERTREFRVGGREILRGRKPGGVETFFDSRIHVIVPERVLITDYDMHVGGAMMSVSLCTLALEAAPGDRCVLRYTEQGTFFDNNPESPANRKVGTGWHVGWLGDVLAERKRS